ncbi:MAG: class I SAM-dependent methyltransferase [Bacteroidetes bacterium]|nr:class I SAM-dependent methyltransferase [Bacteroidota bacterium]
MNGLEFKHLSSAVQYLRFRLSSLDEHDLHSPFVYDLYHHVIRDETPYYAFQVIEAIRSGMMLSQDSIRMTDLGTGGTSSPEKKIAIRHIAKRHAKSARYGQLLFRLVNRFQPKYILELGTSLGITTMYLASPAKNSDVLTIEGCHEIATAARKNFVAAHMENIRLLEGEFSDALPSALQLVPQVDFVFFDGNHRKEATLNYFHQCLEKHHEHSIFVFDDIHWSREMQEAWKEIREHEAVTLSMDLFRLGIVFFRRGFPKQSFVLKY